MKNRTWIAAAIGTAAVMVAVSLWADASRTGHTDGGLKAGPAGAKGTSPSGAVTDCTGTRPPGSLPGFPGVPEGSSDDTPLYRTLAYIDLDAKRRYSAAFTGLSIDEPHRTLKVWRIPSAALDADLCGAAEKGVKIRLYDTDVNRKTLDALADRISEDMHRWDGTFQMREVGVQEEGFVGIGVDDPAKAEPILKEAYGERYLKVGHVEQAQDAG
ncbi:hypothetical protein [Streptomyces sp. GESEQ-35]|uniref:hypothetical protein n=1 Tax=Streptomyces sp. GESEQ-35 TaxID=2812657 RepID=UPI001B33DA96|nr:hypothetical protein [Streptomyces sp. GESEQ-35]